MKKCPQCGREYDVTMMFCLDDGMELLYGPAVSEPGAVATGFPGEPQTAILHETASPSEAAPRAQIHTTELTDALPNGSAELPVSKSFDRRLLIVPVVLAVIAIGGFLGYRYFQSGGSGQINSIAVLPFENRSGNADTDYLSDGLADSLIYRLSQLPNLKVSPTSSVMRYKGPAADPAKAAGELGVDAVMTGRLSQIGDNLNISVQLVDVKAGKVLWAGQYDRKMADLLATQREIAAAITQKLQLKLSGNDTGITKKYTDNNEAYQLFLKGRYYLAKRTKDGFFNAIESFQQAIKVDPNFALAYAGVAETYMIMPSYGYLSPREAFPQSKAAALQALDIDATVAEAYTALASTSAYYERDWTKAESEFKRAIDLNPNIPNIHYQYGYYLTLTGRSVEGIREFKRSLELDPLSIPDAANLAGAYLNSGQNELALEQAKKTYDLAPDHPTIRYWLGAVYIVNGMNAEAITLGESVLKTDPANQDALFITGYAYAKSGRQREAEEVLRKFKAIEQTQYVLPYYLAGIYTALGDKDKAFAELERSFEARDSELVRLKVDPMMVSLRTDPRYKDLLRRMNLPE